jgi:cyclophilin family peptidyl-prolyl cis-trans isomerase
MHHALIAVVALLLVTTNAFAQAAVPAYKPAPKSADAGDVIVFETVKGTFEIETYPKEAPKTVEQILRLVGRRFYNGQRIHRVVNGFVVQFGDPQTRDMTKRDWWGRGFESGSGRPVGVLEANPKRTHIVGAVALAHPGDPKQGDSQMYITLAAAPRLNGNFTVFGKVISGMDVVRKLEVTDVIRRATVRVEGRAAR